MRNNAAYLPENPIVYIIFPESIHNRASFCIFVGKLVGNFIPLQKTTMKILLRLSSKINMGGMSEIMLSANNRIGDKVVTLRAKSEVYIIFLI